VHDKKDRSDKVRKEKKGNIGSAIKCIERRQRESEVETATADRQKKYYVETDRHNRAHKAVV
jgi:hypothetical protein